MDTRARLLATARQAFAEHGHDGVNLKRDILDPAGVSVGSFYHQFSDKTDLLVALLDDVTDSWRASVVGDEVMVRGDGLEAGLRAAFTRFVAGLEDAEDLWRIQLREGASADSRVNERIQRGRAAWRHELVDRFVANGWMTDDVAERAADLLIMLSVGLATSYLDRPRRQRTAAARRALVDDATAFATGGLKRLVNHDGSRP